MLMINLTPVKERVEEMLYCFKLVQDKRDESK